VELLKVRSSTRRSSCLTLMQPWRCAIAWRSLSWSSIRDIRSARSPPGSGTI